MAGSSPHQIKNICVFGGYSPGKENEFLESTNHLGRVLAKRKIHLVYGGGSLRLIGSVLTAVFLRSSQVLSIIPKALAKWISSEKQLERNYKSSQCMNE
jgi:hypothetical protein